MAELQMLLDQEIPGGRKALIDSHNNLQKVASYCSQRYVDEANKKTALEETKNYTTQSLASVAYQINTLASNMLHMLDIQTAQLANMDSAINNIAQTVDIHKEKVARREIGLLTTNKAITRTHQIVAPTNPDRPVKYVRKPIDYTELDDIGHGVKLSSQPNTGTARRTSAAKKSPSSSVDGGSKRDSLKSNMSGHGTLRAVRAPTVPPDYSQNINRKLPSMLRTRTTSNSSSESGSRSSSTGYMPGIGGPPPNSGMPPPPPPPQVPNVPTPPSNIPPPPTISSSDINNMPPPPPVVSPQMGAPPPPPMAPPAPMSSDSGGYSTPNVGFDGRAAPVGGSAESYAETPVMDLPPPPPTISSYPSNVGVAGRNPNLPTTGFTSRITSADMGVPPPPPPIAMPPDILPPPPPSIGSDNVLPSGDGSMEGFSMEPEWAPRTYLEKMVVIYDYSAENADELNLREDQVVYVVKKNDDGWYEGVLNGVTGLFPGNYAEPVSS